MTHEKKVQIVAGCLRESWNDESPMYSSLVSDELLEKAAERIVTRLEDIENRRSPEK